MCKISKSIDDESIKNGERERKLQKDYDNKLDKFMIKDRKKEEELLITREKVIKQETKTVWQVMKGEKNSLARNAKECILFGVMTAIARLLRREDVWKSSWKVFYSFTYSPIQTHTIYITIRPHKKYWNGVLLKMADRVMELFVIEITFWISFKRLLTAF